MKTQMIIQKPNLFRNGKFSNIADYAWIINPAPGSATYPFVKIDGALSKLLTTTSANIQQQYIMRVGVQYRFRCTIANRTTGQIQFNCQNVVTDPASATIGAVILVTTSNGDIDVTFTADGNSFLASMNTTWDGTLYNMSLVETPEQFTLDLSDDIDVPLNYNIDNIVKLNQVKAPFSKSIVIPGTENNNRAFNHIYKINSESLFNPNLKCRVQIINEGISVFTGVLCLDEITKKITNNIENIEYSVSVYGETTNLFEKLGDRTIKDLDFSMYDHEFTIGRINAVWNNDIKLYGNYGGNNRTLFYTSPSVVNLTRNGNAVIINFSGPHFFQVDHDIYIDIPYYQIYGDWKVVEVVSSTAIRVNVSVWWGGAASFAATGNVYIYEYLGIGPWYSLMDHGKYQIKLDGDPEELTAGSTLITGHSYFIFQRDLSDNFLPSGAGSNNAGTYFTYNGTPPTWSGVSVLWKCPNTVIGRAYYIEQVQTGGSFNDDFTMVGAPNNNHGTWFIATGINPHFVNTPSRMGIRGGSILYQIDPEYKTLATKDKSINHWVVSDFIPQIFCYEILIKMFAILDMKFDSQVLDSQAFKRLTMLCDAKFDVRDAMTSGKLVPGKQYMLYDFNTGDSFTNVGAPSNTSGVIFVATGATPSTWTNKSIVAEMVNFNNYLPGMKLKDFFLGILNMFNLAIVEDAEIKNLIHIVKRSDFFTNEVIDWTNKLSSDDEVKITLSNKILPSYYHFKYKDSTDYYNTNYNNDYGNTDNLKGQPQQLNRTYADQPIFLRAEFAQNPNLIELPFEPTVMAGPIQPIVNTGTLIQAGIYADSDKTLSVTYFADVDGTNIKRKSANRISLINIRGTSTLWSINSEGAPSEDIADVKIGTVRIYPFTGHTESHSYYNIMFGNTLASYSPVTNDVVKKTMYYQYWKRYVDELTNVNSKIIECVLKLSAVDIYNVNFSKLYRIGDFVCKLNKITDWNANGDGLCKVEFLLKNN